MGFPIYQFWLDGINAFMVLYLHRDRVLFITTVLIKFHIDSICTLIKDMKTVMPFEVRGLTITKPWANILHLGTAK